MWRGKRDVFVTFEYAYVAIGVFSGPVPLWTRVRA